MSENGKLSLDLDREVYIDRMETKIESPKAEIISPSSDKSFTLNFINSEGSSVDGPLEENEITNDQKQEDENGDNKLKDECWIDRTETKISSVNWTNCLKHTIEQTINNIQKVDDNQETGSDSKKPKKVGNYEITSATSFFLFNTKSTKEPSGKNKVNGSPIKVKEKEVSMLYQMGVEAIGKPVESKNVEEYPLQLADDTDSMVHDVTMATEDSRATTARTGWASIKQESGDVENYLLEEDDDENVIIHLGSEFSQDTIDDGKNKPASTIDMDKYEGEDRKDMSTVNVVSPTGKNIDEGNLADEEDTSLFETEEIKLDKLSQLENALSNIQEDSLHTVKQPSPVELDGRRNYTTQVSAESKDIGVNSSKTQNNVQEDKIVHADDSSCHDLELKQYVPDSSSQGFTKHVHQNVELNIDSKSQESSTKEVVNKQIASQTYSMNNDGLSQDVKSLKSMSEHDPIPPVKLIEVERKFRISSDCRQKLKDMGAVMAKEKRFTDEYYDDIKYKLTLSDCWLRRRNKIWEFKIPPRHLSQKDASTQYMEIRSEPEIMEHLFKLYNDRKSMDCVSMDSLRNELDLDVFATFSTTRQTYHLPHCTVDLDIADFGFEVGEIEVMVSDETRIVDALNIIDDMARKLGMISMVLFYIRSIFKEDDSCSLEFHFLFESGDIFF